MACRKSDVYRTSVLMERIAEKVAVLLSNGDNRSVNGIARDKKQLTRLSGVMGDENGEAYYSSSDRHSHRTGMGKQVPKRRLSTLHAWSLRN